MENKKKKKLSKGAIVLIIGIIIITIPVIVFLGIIISAAINTGKPVVGTRFDNDLNPAITSSVTSSLEKSISNLSDVDNCTIELRSAQYRVAVDTKDNLSSERIQELAVEVYNIVNKELPVSTYFTATDSKKMYDLTINLYNFVNGEDDNMIFYILTKNSQMEAYTLQCVSEPLDEDLAKELRGEIVESQESQ